jgi:hypothetical protein
VYILFLKPPNQAPSFTKGPDESADDENPAQTFSGWATGISAGPPNEAGQSLHFIVTNDNNDLFIDQPAIDPGGNLTFTPKPNMHGDVVVTVTLQDDGGAVNGSVDTSAAQQFNIAINKPHRLFNAAETGARRGLDVTGSTSAAPDGFIVSADVLAVINYINAKGSGHIPDNGPYGPPYCDVNGDDYVVADDVIKVINWINAHPGQSEASGISPRSLENNPNSQPSTIASKTEANDFGSVSSDDLVSLLAADAATAVLKRRRAAV